MSFHPPSPAVKSQSAQGLSLQWPKRGENDCRGLAQGDGSGGAEVVHVEQVKARLCLEMVFQRRWGVTSTKGETGGGTLLDFSRLGVPQGRVSRLFDLITSEGHC